MVRLSLDNSESRSLLTTVDAATLCVNIKVTKYSIDDNDLYQILEGRSILLMKACEFCPR